MFKDSIFEEKLRKFLSFSLFFSLCMFSNTTAAQATYSGSGFSTTVNGYAVNYTSDVLGNFFINDSTMASPARNPHQDPLDGGLYADVCWDSACTGNADIANSTGKYINYTGVGTADTVARTYTGAAST